MQFTVFLSFFSLGKSKKVASRRIDQKYGSKSSSSLRRTKREPNLYFILKKCKINFFFFSEQRRREQANNSSDDSSYNYNSSSQRSESSHHSHERGRSSRRRYKDSKNRHRNSRSRSPIDYCRRHSLGRSDCSSWHKLDKSIVKMKSEIDDIKRTVKKIESTVSKLFELARVGVKSRDFSTANQEVNGFDKNTDDLENTEAFTPESDQRSLSSEDLESKFFRIDAENKKYHQKRRSPAYKHFKDVILADGTHKLKCKWCSETISVIFLMILSFRQRF